MEVRERVMWDIREGVIGADTFIPKHVAIITWKNMSFAGGIDISLFKVSIILKFIYSECAILFHGCGRCFSGFASFQADALELSTFFSFVACFVSKCVGHFD